VAFKTDGGGIAFKCNDIKLLCKASTWGTKLSQLHRQKGAVRIITYSLPRVEYIKEQFNRRPSNIYIICHEKFVDVANQVKALYPEICFAINAEVHSKVLLIEPHTVYVSSANFGSSRWHETAIGLHSKEAHDWYIENSFLPLWKSSKPV